MTAAGIDSAVVVVPVHNEAALLPGCLAAVDAAADAAGVPVALAVVLDRCTDGSADIARSFAAGSDMPVGLVEGAFPGVGAARNAGLRWARATLGRQESRVWTAHTDADSLVPGHWLSAQLACAAAGAGALVGTVVPDEPPESPAGRLWRARHRLSDGHDAVFGANLGARMDVVVGVGGFPEVATGEDRGLVRRLSAAGVEAVASDAFRVTTSARRAGRAPAGFAAYLRDLDAEALGADAS